MPSRWTIAAALTALLQASSVLSDAPVIYDADEYEDLIDESHGFPTQKFHSSDIVAPIFYAAEWNQEDTEPGFIFIGDVYPGVGAGPMIFDARDLSLVYADQQYNTVFSSNVQELNGTKYLTFWEGGATRGHADGSAMLFDEHYDLAYKVTAQSMDGVRECFADFHELRLTGDGTVLVTVYYDVSHRNLTIAGGKADGLLLDSGFQEIDPVNDEVIFKWAASEHFDVDYTFSHLGEGLNPDIEHDFDYAHINSVDKTEDGNYLISSRHMGLLSLISGETGDPIWILGGRHNQFTDLSDGMATNFGWQHDARFLHNQSHITVFDNHVNYTSHCDPDSEDNPCLTRMLHLELDTDAMTVRVVRSFYHPGNINSEAMGSVQVLDNDNVLMGWGVNPSIVEFGSDGQVVMDIRRGRIGKRLLGMAVYRAHKGGWKGMPNTPPSLAIHSPNGTSEHANVFVSWNGATEVAEWVVYGTNDQFSALDEKNILAATPRTGFETTVALGDADVLYLAAAALDSDGNILGSTAVVDVQTQQVAVMQGNIQQTDALADLVSEPETDESHEIDAISAVLGGCVVVVVASLAALVWRAKSIWRWLQKTKYEQLEQEEVPSLTGHDEKRLEAYVRADPA